MRLFKTLLLSTILFFGIGGCSTPLSNDIGPVSPVNPQYEQSKYGEPQLPEQTPWWKFK